MYNFIVLMCSNKILQESSTFQLRFSSLYLSMAPYTPFPMSAKSIPDLKRKCA